MTNEWWQAILTEIVRTLTNECWQTILTEIQEQEQEETNRLMKWRRRRSIPRQKVVSISSINTVALI